VADKLSTLDKQATALEGQGGRGNTQQEPGFANLSSSFGSLLNVLQDADMPPTSQAVQGFTDLKKQFDVLVSKWEVLKKNP
jgi:hypothetical protein